MAAYVDVLVAAARWAQAHTEEAAQAIAAEAGIQAGDIPRCFEADFASKLLPQLSEDLIDQLDVMKRFLLERRYLRQDFEVRQWIDPRPLERALARQADFAPSGA